MEARNWVGIVIILVGVVLQPVGFMFAFWVQCVSAVLIVIGVFIFVTQKYIERSEANEYESRSEKGHVLPGDINENSGWGSGGRSESWSSSDSSDGGGGGGE